MSGAAAEDRKRKIQEGKYVFLGLLESIVSTLKERAAAGDTEAALVLLGLASHLVQDLTFHRGMTLAQHSGLAYLEGKNPDFLPNPKGSERYKEATDRTKWLFTLIRSHVSQGAWDRMQAWQPPGDFVLRELLRRTFGLKGGRDSEDIGVTPLLSYWAISNEYRLGIRPKDELVETSCSADSGTVCWDVNSVISSFETWSKH